MGIVAIKGKHATATQLALKVLEIFSSTFFGLYEPISLLVVSAQLFFSNPHQGPCLKSARSTLSPMDFYYS